jgi:hypothetical protein
MNSFTNFRCHRLRESSLQLQVTISGTLEGCGRTYKGANKINSVKSKLFCLHKESSSEKVKIESIKTNDKPTKGAFLYKIFIKIKERDEAKKVFKSLFN